eukprot:s4108_g8.t1
MADDRAGLRAALQADFGMRPDTAANRSSIGSVVSAWESSKYAHEEEVNPTSGKPSGGKQKGGKGKKGKAGKGYSSTFLPGTKLELITHTPDGQEICYRYNMKGKKCDGKCNRVHICRDGVGAVTDKSKDTTHFADNEPQDMKSVSQDVSQPSLRVVYIFAGHRRRADAREHLQVLAAKHAFNLQLHEVDLVRGLDQDVLDEVYWTNLLQFIRDFKPLCTIATPPCSTYSRARHLYKKHPGPRPIRSRDFPGGFPWLDNAKWQQAQQGTALANKTWELAALAAELDGDFCVQTKLSLRSRVAGGLPDSFQLAPLGELTIAPWDYGYASLGHRLVYAKRSAPSVGIAIGDFKLDDTDALAVRDYARAHPFEDVDPQALSAEAGVESAEPGLADEQQPQQDVGGPSSSALVGDSNMLHGESAPITPLGHGEKHGTEHEQEGSAAKKSHVESSTAHGDVVPQTPVESAELLDDTPFEQMASPQKIGRHGDRQSGVNLLGCIRNIECLDIEPDVPLQCDDVDTLIQHELSLNDDPYEEGLDLDKSLKELSFPYSAQEPNVSAEELQRLDAIADIVEVQRLFGLEVLQEDNLPYETKSLSTRFVPSGNPIWLRRSRLVAREYTWLQPDRESLFSPATSNIASRILPVCFLSLREHQDAVMVSINVKDAFLTVKQEVPTHVSCTDAAGSTVSYSLGRVLPGQRDGSLLWYKDLAKFVRECCLEMTEFKSHPSILKSKSGDCFLMIHVDDLLVVGTRKAVMEELIPALKTKYSVSVEMMSKGGDEVCFLKRTHCLLDDGRMLIKCHHKHLGQLCKLLHLCPKLQSKKHLAIQRLRIQTTPRSSLQLMHRFTGHVWEFSCIFQVIYLSVST